MRFALVLLSLAAVAAAAEDPRVELADEPLTGIRSDSGVAAFLGVPFAQPPTGEWRWRPPRPLAGPPSGNATAFAPACMQGSHMVDWYGDLMDDMGADPDAFPAPRFSEDCLYLNIWTPSVEPDADLPVLVWIHGGGHRGGWSYEPNYIGEALAARGAVVVSIAYRLDVFGFFSHPELPQSNFGLLDQLAALEWIAAYIRAFGGDAGNVTLVGESAGAASAGYLMSSPPAQGLFHRVIHQSAGYQFIHRDRRSDFLDQGEALESRVTGGRGSGIDTLRQARAADILAAAAEVYEDYQPDAVVDGHTLVDAPVDRLEDGRLAAVDLLIGSNADEWKMYLDADTDAGDVAAWFRDHPTADQSKARHALATDTDPVRQLDRLETARQFVCPSLALADAMRSAGKSVYVYYFSRVRSGTHAARIGAYHGAEIAYVFGTHDAWLPTDATDRRISEAMAGYWLRFAASGNPNRPVAPRWPRYRTDEPTVLEIGDRLALIDHPERDLCLALDPVAGPKS